MGRILVVMLLAVAVVACGSKDSGLLTVEGVKREVPRGAPVEETVRGLTAFGHALYAASADPAKNTVISPLSIAYAFGMARAGAAGATATELDKLFGFPSQGPHTAFNALTRQILTVDGPPPAPSQETRDAEDSEPAPPILGIANGLFAQRGWPVKQDFRRTLAAQYGAGVHLVDFAGDATEVIDTWADEQTAGRIKKVFDQLDPRTKLVIANAIYLKADWQYPFAEETPEPDATFTRADSTTTTVDLMRLNARLRYATGPGWQAVELPYAKSELAMWVLVPQPGTPPASLLDPDTLGKVRAGLTATAVQVALPKWDFGTDLDLMPQLAKLGLTSTDFSGMADGVFLGQAIHRANITVDEWGTEAAAVTALAFLTSGHVEPPVQIRADHPFAFAIVHRPTSTPLFIGHVADPTATS